VRTFETGATRDTDENKLDFEGFLSPLVIERFAAHMHANRLQKNGVVRPSDNWQKGIPLDVYMKSGYRHFVEWWKCHRNIPTMKPADKEEALCGLIFNAMGYLHELLKERFNDD
jgi:hypothetical protein